MGAWGGCPGFPRPLAALVAEVAAPGYRANGAGPPMTVAGGSRNAGGAGCWRRAIEGGAFTGSLSGE